MDSFIEVLRLFTRGGWVLLVLSLCLVAYELSSNNIKQTRRRLDALLIVTIIGVSLLNIADFFINTIIIKIVSIFFNLSFLYGLSFYLLHFRSGLKKRVDFKQIEETRLQIERTLKQMKRPLVK